MPLVHVHVHVLVPTQRNDLARCCRRPSRPSRISHGLLWTHVGCAGVGWDENGMGWARYCTWDVVLSRTGSIGWWWWWLRLVDWTGLLDILDVRGY